MTDLWPNFSSVEVEENHSIEILRAQARLLEKKTSGKVKATFSKISYKTDSPSNSGLLAEALVSMASMVGEKKVEVLDDELTGKTDANELYNFQPYKFEIYNEQYRFRVFVLRNRMMFPIHLDVDEGIRSELILPTDIKIQSNSDLTEVVSNIFASHKLGTIVAQMMAENNKR